MKTKLDTTIRIQNPLLNKGLFPTNLPYALTIDRLDLTFIPTSNLTYLLDKKDYFICPSEEVSLKLSTQEDKDFVKYPHLFHLYYKKERVALLGTGYNQKGAGKDLVKLRFEKQVFYTKPRHYWHDALAAFMDALPIQLLCISYIEIALDANREFRDHLGHLYNYSTKNIHCLPGHKIYQPKSKATVSTSHGGKTILIGNKDKKQIAIYDKGADIKAKGTDYILPYFQSHGLDIESPIHRIEVRLRKAVRKYNIPLAELTKPSVLFSLFKEELQDNLRYKDLTQYTYENRNKKYQEFDVLPFELLDTPQEVTLERKQKEEQQKPAGNAVTPSCLKQLVQQYLYEGSQVYLNTIKEVVAKAKVKGAYGYIEKAVKEFCPETITEDFFSQRIDDLLSTEANPNNPLSQDSNTSISKLSETTRDMKIKLLISINQELKNNLEELAKVRNTNKSRLIRELVQEAYLRELQAT